MEKQNILNLMKVTAAANGGKPLGRLRFETQAGIKEYHWSKYWPRYNELVLEAGLAPNAKTTAYSRADLAELLAVQTRTLGRFPTRNELRTIGPSEKTFRTRFGSKVGMLAAVREHCQSHAGYEDVLALCPAAVEPETEHGFDKIQRAQSDAAIGVHPEPKVFAELALEHRGAKPRLTRRRISRTRQA